MTQEKLVISLSGKKKYAKKKLLQDFQRGITHVFWQYYSCFQYVIKTNEQGGI